MSLRLQHYQIIFGDRTHPRRCYHGFSKLDSQIVEYILFYLGTVYSDSSEGEVKVNLLELFKYLTQSES